MSTRKSYRSIVAEQAREEKQRLLEERNREVEVRNSELSQVVLGLENLLENALSIDSNISFSSLMRILVKSSTESGHAVQRRSEATLVGAL